MQLTPQNTQTFVRRLAAASEQELANVETALKAALKDPGEQLRCALVMRALTRLVKQLKIPRRRQK